MANLPFLPGGAAVIELKQHGEFGTQLRDIAVTAQLHHFAVRSPSLHKKIDAKSGRRDDSWNCPGVRLPPSHTAGADATFCPSMSFASKLPLTVDVEHFRVALADALAVTGLVPLECVCSDSQTTGVSWWTNANGGLR